MEFIKVKVKSIEKIKPDIFLLAFDSTYLAKHALPGQFLHLKIKSAILRRPLSIHNIKGKTIYILFRVRGKGTDILSRYKVNDSLDILGPLGKGFDVRCQKTEGRQQNILIAGGIGVAPLIFLAKRISEQNPKGNKLILLGAKTKKDILCEKELKKIGFKIAIATDNGSRGFKGTVVGLLKNELLTIDHKVLINIYSCGPEVMLKAIYDLVKVKDNISLQVSFEQFMGCGVGICCGCSIEAKDGYKKVCKDGPVFPAKGIWG